MHDDSKLIYESYLKEMAIKKASDMPQRKPEIDIRGPEGNAFALMATARGYLKQLGYDKEEIQQVMDSMQSSDYENLLRVFDKYLGDFVDIIR
jgi:Holliday junction resolvasome RuvABC DNA-binding subunit|tara:strand:+ start:390 stop:668 length:279 start_codon:yes stop_codon:yes gene_type:complete